jgi:hypothetical protein
VSSACSNPFFYRTKLKKAAIEAALLFLLSGRRDSNPRRQPWQNHRLPFRGVTERYK